MSLKFIIGLGNPGKEFKNTRHNIGFELLDELINYYQAKALQVIQGDAKKLKSKTAQIPDKKLLLVYPQTFMNLSGQAVRAVIDWYKITDLSNIVVVHDDVSLSLGQMRLIENGGAGGQHGIESIIEHLGGNKNFRRLKFGVGPDPGGDKRSQYVLGRFPEDQQTLLVKSQKQALECLTLFVEGSNYSDLMNKFNGIKLE
jgi:PTH1 family peptidyl-tRNA hydrolase